MRPAGLCFITNSLSFIKVFIPLIQIFSPFFFVFIYNWVIVKTFELASIHSWNLPDCQEIQCIVISCDFEHAINAKLIKEKEKNLMTMGMFSYPFDYWLHKIDEEDIAETSSFCVCK
jgi:hypothetical protein